MSIRGCVRKWDIGTLGHNDLRIPSVTPLNSVEPPAPPEYNAAMSSPKWGPAVAAVLLPVLLSFPAISFQPADTLPADAEAESAADWPMLGHDASRTGYNSKEGALKPPLRLKWAKALGSWGPPSVAGDTVYVGSDKTLYALDTNTGDVKWTYEANGRVASPTIASGSVYFGTNTLAAGHRVYALDAATGSLKWSYIAESPVETSPAVADGMVYVTAGPLLYALDAATGTLRWRHVTMGLALSPALVDGVVYLSSYWYPRPYDQPYDSKIEALDAETGSLIWTHPVGDALPSPPTVANGVVYGASYGLNGVFAVDAATGRRLWTYRQVGGGTALAVAEGTVYAVVGSTIVALDAATGRLKWYHGTSAYFGTSSVAVANGIVYTSTSDRYSPSQVLALSAATGDLLWRYPAGGGSSPVVANGMLYHSADGKVYAFETESRLSVVKAASRDRVYPGDTLSYMLLLDNSGPDPVSITITDMVPFLTSYVTNTVSGGATYSPTIKSIVWSGTVPPGLSTFPSLAFSFRVQVDPFDPRFVYPDVIKNTVLVSFGDATMASTATTAAVQRRASFPVLFNGASAW